MSKRHTSNDIRAQLCDLVFNKDYDLKDAALALDVKYKTAYHICKIFIDQSRSDKKKPPGRKTQFKSDIETKIRGFFEDNLAATLTQCKKFLEETRENTADKIPSLTTIDRILKKQKISFKKSFANKWRIKKLQK